MGIPSICQGTRRKGNQSGSLRAWNMENKHKIKIQQTSFIICAIPDLWPAGTQARNNDQRRSLIYLRILPRDRSAQPRLSYANHAMTDQGCQGQVSVPAPRCQPGLTRHPGSAVIPSHSTAQLYSSSTVLNCTLADFRQHAM
jgi:hypothetical protein